MTFEGRKPPLCASNNIVTLKTDDLLYNAACMR